MGSSPSKNIHSFQVLPDLTAAFDLEPLIFDSPLHKQTVKAIHPIADEDIDSIGDTPENFYYSRPEVVASILKPKAKIWKNKEFLNVVQMYLDTSSKTLGLFKLLEDAIVRARNSHSDLQSAINIFKKETPASYNPTLEKLKVFQAAGDPFPDDFFTRFEIIYKQQIDTLTKLLEEYSRLDAKLKSNNVWWTVSIIILSTAFVVVIIATVYAAVIGMPLVAAAAAGPLLAAMAAAGPLLATMGAGPLLEAMATAVAVPLGTIAPWLNAFFSKKEMKLIEESGIIDAAHNHTFQGSVQLKNIHSIVNIIVTDLEDLSKISEAGDENQGEGLNSAIDEMKKKSKGLLKSIDKLDKKVLRSKRYISLARTKVMKTLEKYRGKYT